MDILFICSGNTCRSPMAEAYFRNLCEKAGIKDIHVSSSGTCAYQGHPASNLAISVMKDLGIDLTRHRSTPLDREMIESSDLIIAMTQSHRIQVGKLNPQALKKTKLLLEFSKGKGDIADPFGADINVYSLCFDEMRDSLDNLFLEIKSGKMVEKQK